jgi:hypothetical protein
MTDLSQDHESPVLLIGPGEFEAAPSLTLRISPDCAKELTERLDVEGIRYSTILEHSAATVLAPYLVYIGPAGGLAGLAAVIRAVCHRNDGKQFKIKTKDGEEYSGQGLSEDKIIRLLEAARGDDPDGGSGS